MSSLIRARAVVAALASAAIACAATACSSADSPSSGNAPTSGPVSAQAVAAQKIADEFMQAPTTIPQTEPLPAAPPKGKTFVFLRCEYSTCQDFSTGIEAATKAAGWNYQAINYKFADPASLTAAFKQALTLKPTVVSVSSNTPDQGWQSELPAYKAAGVPIITIGMAEKPAAPEIIAHVLDKATTDADATALANWFVADSNAEGKVLIHKVPADSSITGFTDALTRHIQEACTKCEITDVQSTMAQISSGVDQPIVAAIKRDPNIKYVIGAALLFDSLPSAMASSGVSAKIAGAAPSVPGLSTLKSGKFAALAPHALVEAGWVAADIAFRYSMNLPIPKEDAAAMPTRLLLPSSDFSTTEMPNYPVDYQAQFTKLWNLD